MKNVISTKPHNDDTLVKDIIKLVFIYEFLIAFIIFIVELIFKNFKFNYTLSFLIGVQINILLFLFSSFVINKVTTYYEKVSFILITSNLIKLVIYGFIMYLVLISPLHYGIFTCTFGMLSVRICILIKYQIIEPYLDKHRKVSALEISDDIKLKLKDNNILLVNDLIQKNRKELSVFLNNEEIEKIIISLKKYELFLKGEIEVIKYENNYDD